MKKNGSTILIFLLISAVILLYYTNCWHSVSLTNNLAYKKYEYEKNFRLTEALYKYGLVLLINNLNFLLHSNKESKPIIIYNGPWPLDSKHHRGMFEIVIKESNIVNINTTLIDNSKNVSSISAVLQIREIGNENYSIKEFEIVNYKSS